MSHSLREYYRFNNKSRLSNYYECKVCFDGRVFGSAEAAYHSMKFTEPAIRNKFVGLTPDQSKELARSMPIRSDWEQVKFEVMFAVLKAKFSRNILCRKSLMQTYNCILIENTTGWHDKVWGKCFCPVCKGEGANNLGIMLMKIREMIKEGNL